MLMYFAPSRFPAVITASESVGIASRYLSSICIVTLMIFPGWLEPDKFTCVTLPTVMPFSVTCAATAMAAESSK